MDAKGSQELQDVWEALVGEVRRYEDDIKAHLISQERFPRDEAGFLEIPAGIETACEGHREAIVAIIETLPAD